MQDLSEDEREELARLLGTESLNVLLRPPP
jgi:hypothetical protein